MDYYRRVLFTKIELLSFFLPDSSSVYYKINLLSLSLLLLLFIMDELLFYRIYAKCDCNCFAFGHSKINSTQFQQS